MPLAIIGLVKLALILAGTILEFLRAMASIHDAWHGLVGVKEHCHRAVKRSREHYTRRRGEKK